MLILLDEIADFRDITSRFPAEFGFTFQIDFFHDLSIFPDQHVVMTTTLIRTHQSNTRIHQYSIH